MATIWTIGHSTRSASDFLDVLDAHRMEAIIDVRRFPGSRRLPQFSEDALRQSLTAHGIVYEWLPSLGGRRRPVADSPNDGWRNDSFRGYADHIETEEFAQGLNEVLSCASGLRTAIMCAEVLWWRCHRRLISDVLLAQGNEVLHIRDESSPEPHRLTSPARLIRGRLSYAAEKSDQAQLPI